MLLFHKSGLFLNLVPTEVNFIEIKGNYKIFTSNLLHSIFSFAKSLKFSLLIQRLLYTLKNNFSKNRSFAEQRSWKNIANAIPILEKEYDVAIAFLEKSSIYYVIDKVKARKKIGWIHNDYTQLGLNANIDFPYLKEMSHIFTVSEACKDSLVNTFPSIQNKFKVIYNVVSKKTIRNLAKEPISFNKGINITTLGRLHKQKGYDIAIKACKMLVDKGIDVYWHILGEGVERKHLEELIKTNKLENRFLLLGIKENPYPYINSADIYVQASRFEGKSIAIDEAKILCKPIVVTNFTTVKDQLTDNVTALIAEITPESLAEKIIYLAHNKELQQELTKNLCAETNETETEIYKLYRLIES